MVSERVLAQETVERTNGDNLSVGEIWCDGFLTDIWLWKIMFSSKDTQDLKTQ